MSFAYSAGVITQTGTDTNLSGLSGLTGVTTIGDTEKTIYVLTDIVLDIDGTLNLDPELEGIYIEDTTSSSVSRFNINSTGTLNVNGLITSIYPAGKPSKGTWLTSNRRNNNVIARFDGVLNWRGGVVCLYPQITVGSSATILYDNAILDGHHVNRYQLETSNVTFDGPFEILGFRTSLTLPSVTLNDYVAQTSRGIDPAYTSGGFGVDATVNNYTTGGNSNDSQIRYFSWVKINDTTSGGQSLIDPFVPNAVNSNNGGVCEVRSTVGFQCNNIAGNPVQGVKIQIQDYNNGSRQDVNSKFSAKWGSNFDFTSDRTYTWTTDVSGVGSNQLVLTRVDTLPTTDAINDYYTDYRDKDGDGSDRFDVFYASYGYILGSATIVLRGVGGNTFSFSQVDDLNISESVKATVDAYTELETPEKFYDRAKAYLYDNYAGETSTIVSRSGNTIDLGSYDLVIDATASPAFALAGNTITIHADTFTGNLTTTGTITLSNGAIVIGSYTDTSGTTTTLSYAITGLVANSRVQIYNVTTATEVSNAVVAGTSVSGTYNEGGDYTAGDSVRIRVTNVQGVTAYSEYQATVQATSSGWSALVSQELCVIYNTLGIDGSAITQFSADYVNDELDIDTAGNFTLADLYAWWKYNLYTEQGIREFYGGITAVDEGNFRINTAVLSIYLDNTTANDSIQTDNRRLYRDDGARPVTQPTSGGGGVDVEWRSPVSLADTEAITADLAIIKTRTGLIPATV